MSEDNKPTKKFVPGTVVRVRGQLMGVGQASLRGLLDEAEDIADITQKERIAAREGVALEGTDTVVEGEDVPVDLNPDQKSASDLVKEKIERENLLFTHGGRKEGLNPGHPALDPVPADQAEAESKLGETSKPPVEPGTIGDGEPPEPTDEDDTEREDATGQPDPEPNDPEFSDKATDAEVEGAENTLEVTKAEDEAEAQAEAESKTEDDEPKSDAEVEAEYIAQSGAEPEVELTRGQKAAATRAANKAKAESDGGKVA